MKQFKFTDSENNIYIVFANTQIDAINKLSDSDKITIEQIKTIKEVKK